jgi:hypothetical protein
VEQLSQDLGDLEVRLAAGPSADVLGSIHAIRSCLAVIRRIAPVNASRRPNAAGRRGVVRRRDRDRTLLLERVTPPGGTYGPSRCSARR